MLSIFVSPFRASPLARNQNRIFLKFYCGFSADLETDPYILHFALARG